MKLAFFSLGLFCLSTCFFRCNKEPAFDAIRSRPVSFTNSFFLSNGSIRIHYLSDSLISISLKNTEDFEFPSRLMQPSLDSFAFVYSGGILHHGIHHIEKYQSIHWHGSIDSSRTGTVYFERDNHQRIVAMIDSLNKTTRTEFCFDSLGRFTGKSGMLYDHFSYQGNNVIRAVNPMDTTEYLRFDGTYNPYQTVNKLLGFPLFHHAYQVSENNPIRIKSRNYLGEIFYTDWPVEYDALGRVISFSSGIDVKYEE